MGRKWVTGLMAVAVLSMGTAWAGLTGGHYRMAKDGGGQEGPQIHLAPPDGQGNQSGISSDGGAVTVTPITDDPWLQQFRITICYEDGWCISYKWMVWSWEIRWTTGGGGLSRGKVSKAV